MIDRFGAARLLAFDRDPVTREPTVEVAHEALIREWPRLRHWLDDDRDGLRVHRHLTDGGGRVGGVRPGRAASCTAAAGSSRPSSGPRPTPRPQPLGAEFLAASIEQRGTEVATQEQRSAASAGRSSPLPSSPCWR